MNSRIASSHRSCPLAPRPRGAFLRALGLLAGSWLAMFGTPTGLASTFTWSGADDSGDMSVGNNWGGTAPTSDTAHDWVFATNTKGQSANNTIANPSLVHGLTFSSGLPAFSTTGSGIELGGTSPTITQSSANAVTIGNALTLDSTLTLVKPVSTGTLTFSQPIGGPSAINLTSAVNVGNIAFTANGSTNTYAGFTVAAASTINFQIGMNDPFGTVGVSGANISGQSFTFTGINQAHSVAGNITGRSTFTFAGNYNLTMHGQFFRHAGLGMITSNIGAADGSGAILLLDNAALYNTSANNYGFNSWNGSGYGKVSGVLANPSKAAVAYTKSGSGTWALTGANTFSLNVDVQNGTLEFNSVENKGSTTANALGKPATTDGTTEAITLGNTITTGTLKYTGTGHSSDRLLKLAGTTGGGTLDASGTGPISFLGGVAATGVGAKSLTLTGTNTGANTLGGDVVDSSFGATALAKNGAGKWVLTGVKNYTGATTVNAGTLLVNGAVSATASTSVKATATLGGSGTLAGTLAVDNGGTLAPGAGVGTLTSQLAGAKTATFASGAAFAFDLAAPGTGDALAFTGLTGSQVTFNGNVINFTNVGGLATGTYTLFTFDANGAYTGTLAIGSGLEIFSSSLIYNANNIQLQVDPGSTPLSTVTIAKTTDGAEEGPVNGSFTISRDNPDLALTVLYTVTGTATPGSDYTALPGTVTLGAGVSSTLVSVPVSQDNNFTEESETVIATLTSDASYTVGAPSTATVDIADGSKPVITLANAANGSEAGPANASFTVSRPAGESSNYALTVNYTVDDASTATAGTDYTALAGSVVIAAGQNSASITVPVLQDINFTEGSESVILNLTANAAYTIGGTGGAAVSISDGTKPSVTMTKTSDGAEAGPVNGVITVTRSTDNGSGTALTVDYTVNASSTATPGSDYTALGGSVLIAIGATTANITLPVLQDSNFTEGTENVTLNLAAGAGYTTGTPDSATVNITDGSKSEISVVKTNDGDEAGQVNGIFTISRLPGTASSGPVTVHYSTGGTATAGSDYTTLSGSVVIPLGATTAAINVPVLHDSDFTEGTESVIVTLTADAAYTLGTPLSASLNIANISGAPVIGQIYPFTATYPFTNTLIGSTTDPTPPPYEKGIAFGSFSMTGNGKNSQAGAFYADSWNPSNTPAAPFQAGQYFEVTLTPAAPAGQFSTMTLHTIRFDLNRQLSIGPVTYALRSSLDHYAANISTFTIDPANAQLTTDGSVVTIVTPAATAGTWQAGAKLTLDSSFQNLTAGVTFRIYGWGGGQNKDGGIDNFQVQGEWIVNNSGSPDSSFAAWAVTNAPGQTASQDHDQDGVANGVEYFMGETGSGFTANPGIVEDMVTWPKDPAYSGSYSVQSSPDLGIWTPVTATEVGATVQYTLPRDQGKRFVRLVVEPN